MWLQTAPERSIAHWNDDCKMHSRYHAFVVIVVMQIDRKMCFVTEWCEKGSLDKLHDRLDMTEETRCVRQRSPSSSLSH